MILVADCGATKADWALADNDGTVKVVHTRGFNPVVHPPDLLRGEVAILANNLLSGAEPSRIYYYGAGCWDLRRKAVVADELSLTWPKAEVIIMHDLLGAARATCGSKPGIACILGTGSNTCLYDGEDVIDNVTNLGYLLGDEGSGSYLGRQLLRAYFYRELDATLQEAFEEYAQLTRQTVLDKVYESETPNVYLASYTKFLGQHLQHPLVQRIVFDGFAEFIDRHVRKYRGHLELPIHFIGSIAFYFKDILSVVLAERDMQMGKFIQKPIDELIKFHLA